MRLVYRAASPTLAHVLRGALEAAGVEAEVRRDVLFSTRGETPVTTDTLPEVWVTDAADPGVVAEVVAAFDAPPSKDPGPQWVCPHCAETVEPQLARCWNCGR